MKEKYKDYFDIILGSTLFSLSVTWFADPAGLVIGGVSGIGIIIKSLSNDLIPIFVTNLVLNIPLFLISIKQRGFKFIYKSLISVLWMTITLELSTLIKNPLDVSNDFFLTALMAGVFAGIGLGLILRATATSGGTDMIASIVKFAKPHLDISNLLLVIDAIIILLGMSVFGVSHGIYAVLSVYISTKIINIFLDGAHFQRGAFILSDKYNEISEEIIKKLDRGNTGINVKGMYSKKDKKMLFVIVDPKESILLQNIVKTIDKKAFMVIFDVRRALGEGFYNFEDLDKKI